MTRWIGCTLLVAALAASAEAVVFINEVFINPPGSADDFREFIELAGTPGKKLDGYALALLNGGQSKTYPAGSIPPIPADFNEIDEFFSLDGLSLGANGLLVIGVADASFFPTLLPHTNFAPWTTLWNGGLDTPGKLGNDGSATILLIRRRPGVTQADPANPLGLRWGKDIDCDNELAPVEGSPVLIQYGNGSIDKGDGFDPFGAATLDLRGASTPTIADDLEIVDEVSYEHDQGWEYDVDERAVDAGSTHLGLPARRVHTLDDPAGFNPDALTRVDYRTKGPGWTPAPGSVGELPSGKNWQDTATEQWIRGDSVVGTGGQGPSPQFFYDNAPVAGDPSAVQPFVTNVPLWLADGIAPDFNFAAANSYQIMAGRVNPLATAIIPGDADRDGDCDADDIAKIRAVFADADWVFSNSFAGAPQGDSGDPATQTRPWDVDATGDNGVDPSDLQWTLNFQGSTTGRVIGVTYDSTTPSASGTSLNPAATVGVQVTSGASVPGGHPLTGLVVGDTVQVTVSGAVVAGAIGAAGQQNGIMQYVHDVNLSASGVMKVISVEALSPFTTTRAALETLKGAGGDLGVASANGFTTSFTAGLSGATPLYRVTLKAVGPGTTACSIASAAAPRLAASTPRGVKVGHTASNGNPATASYGSPIIMTVVGGAPCPADIDGSGDVGQPDLGLLLSAYGTCPGDTHYNPAADLSPADPCINQPDLGLLLAVYGQPCP
jgi:hypothetical protein